MNPLLYAARPLANDMASTIIFVILIALKVDVRIATTVAMAVGVGQVAFLALTRRPIAPLHWLSVALVLVFGTASFVFKDPRYVMLKPTVVYAIVGVVMLQKGWMLRYMPPIANGRGETPMIVFGYVWAGLMFATGLANLVVALAFTAAWPAFAAVVPMTSKLALFAIQYMTVRTLVRRRMLADAAAAAA